MIWITRTMQFYKLKSWRVDLFKESNDRGFAYLLQLYSKMPFLFNLIWLLQLWPQKSYTANHGCIRSMRTAADLHPLFRCVLFQIQRTLSLATPFPNWLCYANKVDFSICRMTRRVTWASDRWVYALHLLAKGHAEPCFYVHHLAMIERPW